MKTTIAEFIRHCKKTQCRKKTQQNLQTGTATITKHDCFVTTENRKKYLILFSRNREMADSLKNGEKALFEIHEENDPSPSQYPLGIMVFTGDPNKIYRVTSQFEYAKLIGKYDGVAYVCAKK